MQFSPLTTPALILGPLRYFFSTYGGQNKLAWSDDPKQSDLEIDYLNNLHKIPLQQRPRILVDRGSYRMDKTGVTDNMAQAKSLHQTQGLDERINFILYTGEAQILIEARQQGVCELLTDMVTHFIAWTRPLLCDTQGFKEFGMPMQVGACRLLEGAAEDDHKFQVTISLPYIKEEQWQIKNDGVLLKAINATVNDALTVTIRSPS